VQDKDDNKLYGTATVGTKGQIVIPADVREVFGIEAGDRLYVMGSKEGGWVGLIQEEQMRTILAHMTNKIEVLKDMLDGSQEE